MIPSSYLLSFLALCVGSAVGFRRVTLPKQTGTKVIVDVPVLNYHTDRTVNSLVEIDAEEEWLMMMNPTVTDQQIADVCNGTPNGCKYTGHPESAGVPFLEMRGTEADLESAIKRANGAVKYVEVDVTTSEGPALRSTLVDPDLWGLERVGAARRRNDGSGVVVFLCDSGVRTTHKDFGGRAIPALDLHSPGFFGARECKGDVKCAADVHGHGTHCAGTAAGTSYGVAPGASIRAVKTINDSGSFRTSDLVATLDWIAQSSLRPAVASLSLQRASIDTAHADAVAVANSAGVIVVVAAGNHHRDACLVSPAHSPLAITVGATDSLDRRSGFSNFGSCVDIWAPGTEIKSAGPQSDTATITWNGTSMACPHVSGGTMLVLQDNPTFNRDQVLQALRAHGRQNTITDLSPYDTNTMLYIGDDAPPPVGGVPHNTSPWCDMSTSYLMSTSSAECICFQPLACYKNGVFGACPNRWGASKYVHYLNCTDCACK